MNKVIGEFLSNQQPYPQFMATVVYKVSSITGTLRVDPELFCVEFRLFQTGTFCLFKS